MLLVLTLCTTVGAQNAKLLYEEGKALYDAKKYDKAFPKLKASAEKGNKKAQYRLGRCYDKGHGVQENDVLAFQWYSKGAAQGHAKCQYQVGKCYKNGEGVAKDRKKAVEWFMKAANQDNAKAQMALGKSYFKGKGIAADQAKAKSWIKRAVSNEKGGEEELQELRQKAAEGDVDAKAMLKLIGK